MGQVWQATDTQLNRQVALKILPDAFTDDSDRLARFQREAQVLASLNHPNIGGIHGIEEAEGMRALVLELVEGPTLADRIAEGPIPIQDALPIAKQIAEALEAAHEQGIIHRDLKPANIKVKDEGTVKVLDFGLAKAMAPISTWGEGRSQGNDPDQSPTLTAAATQMGVILGTAAYMSPEQARGKPVDKRTDIWAFGCVLYEMLTGRRAFEGEAVSDAMAAVLRAEPDWETLPPDTPALLHRLLRRCLAKDLKERLHDVADARLEIAEVLSAPDPVKTRAVAAPPRRAWQRPIPLAAGMAALLVISSVAVWNLARPEPAPASPVTRLTVVLPADQQLSGSFQEHRVALSSDGTHVVYLANQQLYLRPLDRDEATPVRGTTGASEPFFSADDQWIGFHQDGQLKRVPVAGGVPVPICDAIVSAGASWSADDTILFADPFVGVFRVAAAGGTPQLVISTEGTDQRIRQPQLRVAFDIRDQDSDIWVWDLTRETLTRLTTDAAADWYAVWTDDERIIFSSTRGGARNLFWKAADGTGAAERLTESQNQQFPYAVSPDGRYLVHLEGDDLHLLTLDAPLTTAPSWPVNSESATARSHRTGDGSRISRKSRVGWRCT